MKKYIIPQIFIKIEKSFYSFSRYFTLGSSLLKSLSCKIERRLKQPLLILWIKQVKDAINVVNIVLVRSSFRRNKIFEGLGAVRSELIMLGDVFGRVFRKFKEACGVLIVISVAHVVQLTAQRLLNVLQLLRGVLVRMGIEDTCCRLELVCSGRRAALAEHIVNTAFNISA